MLILPGVQVSPSLSGIILYLVLPIIKSAMAYTGRATSGTWGKMSLEGRRAGVFEPICLHAAARGGGGVIVGIRQIAVLRCGICVMKGMRSVQFGCVVFSIAP